MGHLTQKLKKIKGGYQEVQIVSQKGDMSDRNSDSDIPLDISDNENNESIVVDGEEPKSGEPHTSKKAGKKKGNTHVNALTSGGGYSTLYK